MGKLISDESGIQSTTDLGKYLGIPVLQKRINKETFGEVLQRVTSRLAGWKSKCLSMAGRLTLTKSVLLSIPVNSMSTILLPASILDGLDRVSRDFIWGSSQEKRKQHLVAWDRVCLPRVEGGLGIRTAKNMNKALLAKVGWRLLADHTSLWARILQTKYKVKNIRERDRMGAQKPGSSTWRSVKAGLRDVVLQGQRWIVGNGRDILFWEDRWLLEEPLVERVNADLPSELKELPVKEFWRDAQGWSLARLSPFLSQHIQLVLAALVVDNGSGARDRLTWGETADGKFTVTSAYSMLAKNSCPRVNMSAFYSRLWRVVAPERVKVFLWLVSQQAIMTNVERHRRHLSSTPVCQVCKGGEETVLHVLRDCPSIAGLWRRVIPVSLRQSFFDSSLLGWLYDNLRMGIQVAGSDFSTLFAMGLWWSWKWRCGSVFGEYSRCRDKIRFVKDLAREVSRAHLNSREGHGRVERIERLIAWSRPGQGWMKLNTDGASHGNPGLATAGGVLRDGSGAWGGGFALHIGICSAPLAELWGVYHGLYLAWGKNVRRLELEVDSEIVVGFLRTGISDSHPLSFLVRLCHGFLSRDWIVRISHVYREANRLADGLANYAFTLPFGLHVFDSVPVFVASIVGEDARGTSVPRQTRL